MVNNRPTKSVRRHFGTLSINDLIQKGLDRNNTKPFWRYIKSKKQDSIGVSPLRGIGQLQSDGKSKAEVLVNQFSSVFTLLTTLT